MDYHSLLKHTFRIAAEAGLLVMSYYNKNLELYEKTDGSFFTEADIRSEELIIKELSKLTPNLPIVSEEAVEAGYMPDIGKGNFWLVDPLDGTNGFIKKNGDFVINIGLIVNFLPVLGVVHVPISKLTYVGLAEEGSFIINESGKTTKLNVRTLSNKELILLLYNQLPKNPLRDKYLAQINYTEIKRDSNVLRFCRIADGEISIHICFESCYEWDTAAGHAIIKGSGGNIIKLDNHELTYGKPGFKNSEFIVHGKKSHYKFPNLIK